MKKNALIPLLLFAAVFCVTQLVQPYTLVRQCNEGLFLMTPDWFGEVFRGKSPVSNLVAGFLVQFYDVPVVGPLIVAALITLIYCCIDRILGSRGLPFHNLISLLTVLVCWVAEASGPSNVPMVRLALIALICALLSLLLSRRDAKPSRRWELPVAVGLILVAMAFVSFDGKVRRHEATARVQVSARRHNWDDVLKTASPERCTVYPELMPYAFMALGEKDALGDNLFRYPVKGPEDLGMEKDNTLEGSLFNSILNECLGVPNEAIHHIFQYASRVPHGMSHLALYQLARYNAQAGNFTLARKYAGILTHNPRARASAEAFLERIASATDAADTLGHSSASSLVVTSSPLFNLAQMSASGINSFHAANRYLCYQLLQGDLEGFRNSFEAADWGGKRIPRHYQEALLLAGADPSVLDMDADRLRRFSDFMMAMTAQDASAMQNAARGTYWAYYLLIKDKDEAEESPDASYPAS